MSEGVASFSIFEDVSGSPEWGLGSGPRMTEFGGWLPRSLVGRMVIVTSLQAAMAMRRRAANSAGRRIERMRR